MVFDWDSGTLADIADLTMGQSPAGITCNEVGNGVPLLNGPTEFGGSYPRPVQFTTDPRKFAEIGDLLFCVRGSTTGRMNWADQRYAIGRGLAAIRSKHGQEYRHFVRAVIDFNLHRLLASATGSTFPNVSREQIREVECSIPTLAEQKAISAVLGALHDKIELNGRINATLEAMARALFQSWFVDFDPVRAKVDGRKPTGLDDATIDLFPEHLEESPIGKKPIGWEVTTLETALSVLEVGGRPKGGVGGITSGIPSIGAESINGVGQFDYSKTKYVPVEFYEGMKKGHIQSHDVLLYKDGGRPGEYEPHVSMFGDGFPFEKCSINEHVYRLRTNDSLCQEYLYFWLTSELALAEMRVKGTGVAIPGLNSTAVRSLTVLVPPKPIVVAFTNQATPLVTRILTNSKQSRTLSTLRDTLLPKLLSGELSALDGVR